MGRGMNRIGSQKSGLPIRKIGGRTVRLRQRWWKVHSTKTVVLNQVSHSPVATASDAGCPGRAHCVGWREARHEVSPMEFVA